MHRLALVISTAAAFAPAPRNEKIKGQFEDENAKFRPVPPVPDTGC